MAKVLVIEDDSNLCQLIEDVLIAERFEVDVANDGQEGYDRLRLYDYDLAILDWELPKRSGKDLLQEYRKNGGQTLVLMLTGKDSIDDKEQGLDSGTDDYLTKPFNPRELLARIRALLRRKPSFTSSQLSFGNITLDTKSLKVVVGGSAVNLSKREHLLLEFFLRNPQHVFAQEVILNHVWSSESDASVDAIKSAVKRLRKALEDNGCDCCITAVYGRGYSLDYLKKSSD